MDKFNQSIEKTKKCIDPSVLTEGALDLFSGYASLFDRKIRAGNLGIGRIAKKIKRPNYNASNVYYLVGGSKLLPQLEASYNVENLQDSIDAKTNVIEGQITYIQEKITQCDVNIAQHVKTPSGAPLLNVWKTRRLVLQKAYNQLNRSLTDLIVPFDKNGTLKTHSTTGTTPKPTTAGILPFEYGITTLPVLIYVSLATAISRQDQNYVKITDMVDAEIRSRAQYAVKLDITKKILNLPKAHDTIMDFIDRKKQTDRNAPDIIYVSRKQAMEYDKEIEKGGIYSRLKSKTGEAFKRDIDTYTGVGKGPTMTL